GGGDAAETVAADDLGISGIEFCWGRPELLAGGAVESCGCSSALRTTRFPSWFSRCRSGASITCSNISVACLPNSEEGWTTVVSLGLKSSYQSNSSKPRTLTSWGHVRPTSL